MGILKQLRTVRIIRRFWLGFHELFMRWLIWAKTPFRFAPLKNNFLWSVYRPPLGIPKGDACYHARMSFENMVENLSVLREWFLMLFLIWFGRWKPVQVNPSYYKNPVKWELLVALAWPAMNLVLAIAWVFIMLLSAKITWMWLENIMSWNFWFWINFLMQFSMINIALAVFNMIPLPPLDGFRIVKMISLKFATFVERYTRYIVIAFLIIVLLWQSPIWNFLSKTSYTIFKLIFTFFANIFY